MSLETATYINSFITSNPAGSDDRSTADDHLRLIKAAILRTWANVAGAVVASHTEMNLLSSLTANVQSELNRIFLGGAGNTASGTVFYARDAGMLGSLSASEYARTSLSETFHKAVVFEEFVTLKAGVGGGVVDLGTLSGTLSINPHLGNYFGVVLAGNIPNITIGAAISAGQVLTIRFQQGAAGAHTVVGWPATVVFADGPSATYSMRTTASGLALITLVRDPLGLWLASPRAFG